MPCVIDAQTPNISIPHRESYTIVLHKFLYYITPACGLKLGVEEVNTISFKCGIFNNVE